MKRPAMLLAVAIVLGGGLAREAAANVSPKVRKACTGDYKRLCPAYKVGSPQLRACMEAKAFELSSRCIDALVDAGEVGRAQVRRR